MDARLESAADWEPTVGGAVGAGRGGRGPASSECACCGIAQGPLRSVGGLLGARSLCFCLDGLRPVAGPPLNYL